MDASIVARVDYFLPHDGGDVPCFTCTDFGENLYVTLLAKKG